VLPVFVISTLVLIFAFIRPQARPRIAPPAAVTGFGGYERIPPTAGPLATPQPIAGAVSQVQLNQLDLTTADGLFGPEDQGALVGDLDGALAYVSGRFGSGPSGRIKTVVALEPGCGLHGIAYTDVRHVQTFTCDDIGRERAVAIMAHEFVHQLEQDRYGAAHLSSDTILAEGAATWGAGEYWLGGKPDFRSYVRDQRAHGLSYPLATDYNGLGITAMNAIYYQWASFVEYLIGAYGREKFDAVYVTGGSAPGAADYAAVYGKGLDALEREWKA